MEAILIIGIAGCGLAVGIMLVYAILATADSVKKSLKVEEQQLEKLNEIRWRLEQLHGIAIRPSTDPPPVQRREVEL